MCVTERRIISLLLCLCLCFCAGCGESEAAAEVMLLEDGDFGRRAYETEEVTLSTLYFERECTYTVQYWNIRNMTCSELAGAALVEICVSKNQEVKAGDVLAVFDVPYSQAELDALIAERDIAWLQYQSGLSGYTVKLQEAQSALAMETPGTAAWEIARQMVQKAQNARDYYETSQSIAMSAIEERIADLSEKLEQTTIVAPIDGVVMQVTGALKVGDVVTAQTPLCTIADPSDTYFTVEYSEVYPFHTGAEVAIYSRFYNDGTEYPGRVLASPADQGAAEGNAVIMADDPVVQREMAEETTTGFVRIIFTREQVISVPYTAVYKEDFKSYVLVLENDRPVRRYVNDGDIMTRLEDGQKVVQIFEGLEPGDLVVIG